eukprot:CAMPEP_0172712454 /NCGR_PEP_ID=MMETSP1074-20121228/61109_1 /TAXON_ID=2916 /ORGANISM="Ceratium fusus, Strain PA161109" /LENGTH=54 /DNA_ID=CAMNT_0013536383 /DNA_START=107 /DNA_END=268 /DNA_ORIENTATION=-
MTPEVSIAAQMTGAKSQSASSLSCDIQQLASKLVRKGSSGKWLSHGARLVRGLE